MPEEGPRHIAWRTVESLWRARRKATDSSSVAQVTPGKVETIFDLFWQHQFDDDRSEVRRKVSDYVDKLVADGPEDED